MSQKANSNISSAAKKWIFIAKTARALIMSVKQFYRLILLTNVCTGMISRSPKDLNRYRYALPRTSSSPGLWVWEADHLLRGPATGFLNLTSVHCIGFQGLLKGHIFSWSRKIRHERWREGKKEKEKIAMIRNMTESWQLGVDTSRYFIITASFSSRHNLLGHE